jgi:DNA-binding response OmpR family regulator
VALVLETQGHLVATAATAEAALACAVVWRPHVVVVDAEVNGLPLPAFCTALRAAASSVAIVVTSLRPASCTAVAACPEVTFLPKPFTPAELDALVTRLVLQAGCTALSRSPGIA